MTTGRGRNVLAIRKRTVTDRTGRSDRLLDAAAYAAAGSEQLYSIKRTAGLSRVQVFYRRINIWPTYLGSKVQEVPWETVGREGGRQRHLRD